MIDNPPVGLTLGPVLHLSDASSWRDFYCRVADEAEIDTVVIGEVVCSKRQHFHAAIVGEVIERLTSAGKRVYLASLALVTLDRELRSMRMLAEQTGFELEANEIGMHGALRGRPHAIGPLVNVYNAATARILGVGGAKTICLPPELPLSSIEAIARDAPGIEFEVFSFGRVPLAISARCAHARVKGFTKDNCQFICAEDPDGLLVETMDGQAFLAINGVQTMSSTCQTLLTDLRPLRKAGVSHFRRSPQGCDMVAVASIFRAVASEVIGSDEGLERLAAIYPDRSSPMGSCMPSRAIV